MEQIQDGIFHVCSSRDLKPTKNKITRTDTADESSQEGPCRAHHLLHSSELRGQSGYWPVHRRRDMCDLQSQGVQKLILSVNDQHLSRRESPSKVRSRVRSTWTLGLALLYWVGPCYPPRFNILRALTAPLNWLLLQYDPSGKKEETTQ